MSSVNGSSWLRQGQKVVCIDATQIPMYADGPMPLAIKAIYTIKDVHTDPSGDLAIRLEEIRHWATYWRGGPETGFNPSRFRPLVTKTQAEDVRAFKSMLRELPATSRLDRLAELLDE